MKYVITAEYPDSVHCSVTRDDGTKFGQYVYGEAARTVEGIESVLLAAEGLLDMQNPTLDAEVRAAIATRVEKVLISNAVAALGV